MRKISPVAIFHFTSLTTLNLVAAIGIAGLAVAPLVPDTYRGVSVVGAIALFFFGLSILSFRTTQHFAPLPYGMIQPNSRAEHRAFFYMLHYILLFNPLLFSKILPFPAMGVLLRTLGTRMGQNTYSAGIVMDPPFVEIGDDSIIGNDAMLISHVIEGNSLGYFPIRIGNRVTVGARSVIMAGVTIEDDASIAVMSVVTKGKHIRQGETWAGVPACCISSVDDAQSSPKQSACRR